MDKRIIIGLVFGSWAFVHAAEPEFISNPAEGKTVSTLSSQHPFLSNDGRFVVFESAAQLTDDDTNKTSDIYLCDRSNHTLRRIPGKESGRSNAGPAISPDGRYIAFHSTSKEDLRKRISRTSDINVFDMVENSVAIIPPASDQKNDGEAFFPRFVGGSRYIVFTSNASNLIPENAFEVRQVYRYDRWEGKTDLLSRNGYGIAGNRLSADPHLSENGEIMVFRSAATNLISGLSAESLSVHLYYFNPVTCFTYRINDNARGFDPMTSMVGAFDMDENGRFVVFEGRLRDLKDPSTIFEKVDLFGFDTSSNTVQLLTTGIFSGRSQSPSISGDGRFVAFIMRPGKDATKEPGGVVVYDRSSEQWKRVVAGPCASPFISRDG